MLFFLFHYQELLEHTTIFLTLILFVNKSWVFENTCLYETQTK